VTELAITALVAVDGVLRLELAGDVDYATVTQLSAAIETAITAERTAELVIDLAAGVTVVHGGHRRGRSSAGVVWAMTPSSHARSTASRRRDASSLR
jgi:hypothetical protein